MAQVTWIVTSRCTAGCPTPSQVLGFAFFFLVEAGQANAQTERHSKASWEGEGGQRWRDGQAAAGREPVVYRG